MFEMLAGRSPFDVVGGAENPDQNTEDYLFQGLYCLILLKQLCYSLSFKTFSSMSQFKYPLWLGSSCWIKMKLKFPEAEFEEG